MKAVADGLFSVKKAVDKFGVYLDWLSKTDFQEK